MYLYGNPKGKRYAAPNEFFPHLLWLVTAKEGGLEYDCTCHHCNPELEKERKAVGGDRIQLAYTKWKEIKEKFKVVR